MANTQNHRLQIAVGDFCCVKTNGLTLPLYVMPFYPYSSSSQHYFGLAVGICKTCLTTINNLSEPVRKLDGQVMKITYDIVDEEG